MSSSDRAAFYGRMSTSRQEASIPDQRDAVQRLAAKQGYQLVGEYLDEGISGDDTERRAGFLKMRDDAGRNLFDVILCWSQDRFGRFDPLEAGYWIKPLRDAGVRLETIAEGMVDWDSFAGRIIYTVQQEGKHAFLLDLSRNVTRGMLAKARRGEWLGGPIPYGYRLVSSRLEPADAVEVETVKWLFATYADTLTSLGELARTLNERGVPGPGGKKWGKTSVAKILRRPTYLGHNVWNRRQCGAYHGIKGGEVARSTKKRKSSSIANDPAEWIWFRNTHTPLIDQETFDRVQVRLIENRDNSAPKRNGVRYLFTGLLRCGHCGWPMHGCAIGYVVDGGERRRYQRYICGNYNLHGASACQCNTVAERKVLAVLLKKLQEEFLKPERLSELKAEIRRQEEASRQTSQDDGTALEDRMKELDRLIDQGAEKWLSAPPSLSAILEAKLEAWRQERDDLARRLEEANRPTVSEADLDEAVERIAARLSLLQEKADKLPVASLSDVLHEMVAKIDLRFRHVPYGTKRQKSLLDGGIISLREDVLVSSPVHSARPLTTVTPARTRPADNRAATRRP